MDELDKKILRVLQRDARLSFTKIAEVVGTSTVTVSERVRKLHDAGIIRAYTTLLNTSKLGMVSLIAMVRVKPKCSVADVGAKISALDEACCVHNVTGDFDFLVGLRCFGHEQCATVIDKIKAIEGVEHVSTHLVLRTFKEEPYVGLQSHRLTS
ncbi:MAG: DNA-binding transcriptional regulator [Candidatus Alkanophagales archaeon MCA70_species_2]|nr:DNA-binding transcriptional regulator [Candidatus Alkanophaga liquidiphilum]